VFNSGAFFDWLGSGMGDFDEPVAACLIRYSGQLLLRNVQAANVVAFLQDFLISKARAQSSGTKGSKDPYRV
jgi:hypothetical protein